MISAQHTSNSPSFGIVDSKETTIFGVPIGRLGLLSRLAMGAASGFLVFFVTFFFAIIGVMIYDTATGTSLLNLNIAYLYIAAPVGIVAMLVSLIYLVGGWARQKFSSGE